MVGHCLSAAGSMELVASLLEIKHQFIFPSINCSDVNPDILAMISKDKIPQKAIFQPINILAKASFGFGDVNGCVILKKYNYESN